MTWQQELDELRRRQELAERMGGPEKIGRQRDAGRLTVRERIAALLDEGSFHEVGALAGTAGYDESGELASFIPANFVTGTGRLDGRKVVVGGDDFTVRGGAADAAIIGKQIYAEQLANELHLPIIRLVEGTGGGGSVKTLERAGHTYVPVNPGWDYVVDNLSMVPVVAAGLGPVAGLGAARLCAAHLSILVEGTAQLFVAGPPVVSSGVGERVDKEQLGGSRVHARNGAVDLIAASEAEAFALIRRFLSYLPPSVFRVAAGRGERGPGQPADGRAARGRAARSAPAVPDSPDPDCRLRRRLGHGSPALRRLDRDGTSPAGRPSGMGCGRSPLCTRPRCRAPRSSCGGSSAAERFGIEEIIDPRETRPLLCDWVRDAYAVLRGSPPGRPVFGLRP